MEDSGPLYYRVSPDSGAITKRRWTMDAGQPQNNCPSQLVRAEPRPAPTSLGNQTLPYISSYDPNICQHFRDREQHEPFNPRKNWSIFRDTAYMENTGKHLIFFFSFPINELVNLHTPVVTMFFCMIINSRTKVIIFIDTQIIQPLTHGSLFKLPRGSFWHDSACLWWLSCSLAWYDIPDSCSTCPVPGLG